MPPNSTAPQGGAHEPVDDPTGHAVDRVTARDATGADSIVPDDLDPDAVDQGAPDYVAAAAAGRAAPRRPPPKPRPGRWRRPSGCGSCGSASTGR